MKRLVTLPLLLLWAAPWAWAAPRLELDLRLDPAGRQLSVDATVRDSEPLPALGLDARFAITAVEVDGRPVARPDLRGEGWRPPAGARTVRLRYQGRLEATQARDHRQVLERMPAMAGVQGSYLPAGTGWYPDPGVPFAYRVKLTLPAGQKGLVPGNLVGESSGREYTAQFDFPHPAEGIDLMAGPYAVSERPLALPGGRVVRVRTWFHQELAELADAYLADSARYIERYSRLIGDYPFESFSVVSSPLPTGFGMPSLTYLGREVLRLPFIRATSLGHEVLHNWWGNGVYPDWRRGNWSEGLTTFLADYAYKEDEGEAAAREARLGWLRDLAAVPAAEDTALKDFTSRRHGISSIVGYNKSAMVFLMLRDLIGAPAFERGLRLFWQRHRFRAAGWADLERAFAEASGRDLAGFFRQWVERPGAPRLHIVSARGGERQARVVLEQDGGYALRVPVRLLVYPNQRLTRWVEMTGKRAEAVLTAPGRIQAVELDPDYRLWRRLDPALLPPILREVFVAPRAGVVVAEADPAWQAAGRELAARLLDAEPAVAAGDGRDLPADLPLLILGGEQSVDRLLARLGLPPRPAELAGRGSARAWVGRGTAGRPYAVVSAADAQALAALGRALPHHGRQSWLVFDGPRAADKGVWPARPERARVEAGDGRGG
ncbi:MAG: M1 family peptidase [Thiobacillaceae bacterium]|nr:M1 family peptidase [Thiobacillaceae bacterium]